MQSESNVRSGVGLSLTACVGVEVLAALRAATKLRHRIVDRTLPLARPNPTYADYIEHLRLMRAWLSPLEQWSGSAARDSALIESDLADAGIPPGHEPDCSAKISWPANASNSYRWGIRYVIEGSRLGAAALHRRLRHALRPHNLRYLRGEADETVDRWPTFLRQLSAAVQRPAEIAEACRGARDAFDALLAIDRQRQTLERSVGPRA